jgi:hypothetical protein
VLVVPGIGADAEDTRIARVATCGKGGGVEPVSRTYPFASGAVRARWTAHRSDWAHFTRWCDGMGATTLPASPQTVAGYLAHLADSGLRASTIGRKLAAIAYAHKLKGHDSPTASEAVHAVIRGIRRRIGAAPAQKSDITMQVLTDPKIQQRPQMQASALAQVNHIYANFPTPATPVVDHSPGTRGP